MERGSRVFRRTLTSLLIVRARRVLASFCPGAEHTTPSLALLIDGENIAADLAVHVLAAAGNVGGATIRRVYGNWRHPALSTWQTMAGHYGLQTIHAAHPVSGKNATDIAITVDAMDLFAQGIRHFCLATSDADYVPLVRRLRAGGCFVLGIGRPETADTLKSAYTVFLTTDRLLPPSVRAAHAHLAAEHKDGHASPSPAPALEILNGVEPAKAGELSTQETEMEQQVMFLLARAYELAAAKGKSEWVSTVQLGTVLQQLEPGFTPRTYGSAKLKGLIQKYPRQFQTQPLKGGQIQLRMQVNA
jgi:hypothetical protein